MIEKSKSLTHLKYNKCYEIKTIMVNGEVNEFACLVMAAYGTNNLELVSERRPTL